MIFAFVAAVFTILLSYAIGDRLLKKVPFRFFTCVGLGCSVLIGVLFLLYLFQLARWYVVLGVAVVLLPLLFRLRMPKIKQWYGKHTTTEKWLVFIIGALVVLHFLGATAPAIDADGLGYHLLVPQLWNEHGGFTVIPWNLYAAWPMNFDLFYGVGLLFDSQQYGRYMHFLFGVLALALTYAIGSTYFSRRTGVVASLMLYSTPMVGVLSGTSYVDLYVLFFGALFFVLVHEWMNGAKISPFVIGVLLGAMIGAKILGYAFAVPAGLFFLWAAKKDLRSDAIFLAGALLLSLPWMIKSIVVMGNPVWPFLYDVFGGQYWSSFAAERLSAEVAGGISRSIVSFLLFPMYLTFKSNMLGEMGFIGAGYLALTVIALFVSAKRTFTRAVMVFVVLNLVTFFFLLHQIRYIIFLFPLLAVLSASVVARAWKPAWVQQVLAVFLALTIMLNVPFTFAYNGKSLGVAVGVEDREAYLTRNLDVYAAISWMNGNIPKNAKVFTAREARTFYLERDHLWGGPNRQAVIDYSTIGSPEDLDEELRSEGVTHYFVSALSLRQEYDRALEEEFLRTYCSVVFDEKNNRVCELTPTVPQ